MIDTMEDIIRAMLLLKEEVSLIHTEVLKIKQQVGELTKRPYVLLKEEWMDGQEVMLALNISKRTLQTLRDSGKLIATQIRGKYYYKVADIRQLLSENYIRYHYPKKP